MNINRPQLLQPLARRYVLGTMSRRARRRFSLWVDEVEAVESAVLAVEADLSALGWSLPVERPSDLVWRRISARIGPGRADASAPAHRADSAVSAWRRMAVALALALVAVTAVWWQTSVRDTVIAEPDAGIIVNEQGDALWLVRLYTDDARASVSVQRPPTPQPNNVYELWVLRDDGVPISLGLLPQSGDASLALSAAAVNGLRRGRTLAVSLEPPGGSPEPAPTGPVLYTTAIVGS